MNGDQLDDLKQFITSVVSQTEARLEDRIDGLRTDLEDRIDGLRTDMNDGFGGVGEAVEQILHHGDEQDVLVNKRLAALEQKVA